jgi:hypothetical protein
MNADNRQKTALPARFSFLLCFLVTFQASSQAPDAKLERSGMATGLPEPVAVYNDWSAYDELSDTVPLTEELALRELDNVVRLKKDGVRIDYYVMDAFWFDIDGGSGCGTGSTGRTARTAG